MTHAPEGGSTPPPTAVGTPAFVLQRGHSDSVLHASFSPDGRSIVTASRDHTARVWDVRSGSLRASLVGHSATVWSAHFSPDGHSIVTGGNDGLAFIWDAHTGTLRRSLVGHSADVVSARFSPDGRSILTASRDHTARVWDVRSGSVRATLDGRAGQLRDALFSPDGRLIITVGGGRTATVWDARTGSPRATLEGHTREVVSAGFSRDGRDIVTTSVDGTARVWDAGTGRPCALLEGHSGPVWDADFSPDGRSIVTAGRDRTVRLWDARTGALRTTLEGHAREVVGASFDPTGRSLLAVGGQRAEIWNVQDGALRATLDGHSSAIWSASFSPDGRSVVTANGGGTATVWDARAGTPLARLVGRSRTLETASFSPDGRFVVSVTRGSRVARVRGARSGASVARIVGSRRDISHASFSPDGRSVITASIHGRAHVWDALTGTLRATLGEQTGSYASVTFSPDGRSILTGGVHGTTKIWDALTGALQATLSGHFDVVIAARFSLDGRSLVTASWDDTARVWDAQTGTLRATLAGHSAALTDARFSPDGRSLVTASRDDTAKVWDAQTGALRTTLAGHDDDVVSVRFSPDGDAIVTASKDRTAKVWDADTGALRATLEGHSGAVSSAEFGPHANVVATASVDGSVRLWNAVSGAQRAVFQGQDGDLCGHLWDHAGRSVMLIGRSGRIEHVRYGPRFGITGQYAVDRFGDLTLHSTPDGVFTGDEDAFSLVLFRLGPDVLHDDLITADQLFERFHRSTLVEDFWAGRPVDLPAGLERGVGRPPSVELVGIPEEVNGERDVTLHMRVRNRGGGVGEVRVFINGARADVLETITGNQETAAGQDVAAGARRIGERRSQATTTRTADVRARSPLYGPGEHTLRARLSLGDNEVVVEAYSVLGEVRGERARATIRVAGVEAAPRRLFLLAVSVGEYDDTNLSLNFTGADARAIQAAFERQRDRELFDEVIVHRLADADATRARFVAAVAQLRREARPEDTLVVYVASHGVVQRCGDGARAYHVLLRGTTNDAHCADSIDTATLTRALAWVPAREKLLLLDTCQSGGAVGEEALRALRGELRDAGLRAARASGVAVIAGSAASQSSFEVGELGHGLFTVTLLRGMEGRAAFGGVGRVGVSNLVRYVSRHLPILSERYVGRAQTPTYGAQGSDFAVATARADDPPLLPLAQPPAWLGSQAQDRGLHVATGSPRAQLREHVASRRGATSACGGSGPVDVQARWNAAGRGTFLVVGRGAGSDRSTCIVDALGRFQLENTSRRGEMRLAVDATR